MASFFSVRLAPGVRISASSRGLRAHVGPRAARIHVGGGRTGVSTGAGPLTYYTSGSAPRRTRTTGYYTGPTRQQLQTVTKEQQAAAIQGALQAIGSIHQEHFSTPVRRVAELGAVPPYPGILHIYVKRELKGVGLFAWRERREAKARARGLADERALKEMEHARGRQRTEQHEIDKWWDALHRNDPEVVLEALTRAFEDNVAPTAAVGVAGDEASLALLVPDAADVIPDREPGITPKGNLSLKKMTKKSTAYWHRELVAGHVLVSASEAFAVAPALQTAAVVAFQREGSAIVPMLAARLGRMSVGPERLMQAGAWELLSAVGDPVYRARGQAGALCPIDLEAETDIARLVEAFEKQS